MLTGFFITGTDTGVGKTILAASLLTAARRRGLQAAPMKPVQTGCVDDPSQGRRSPDLDLCLSWAGMEASPALYDLMAPVRLTPACSPHLAARLDRRSIRLAPILAAAHSLAATYSPLFIEGAGGVLVPLNDTQTMLDLMIALDLPVLIAARAGLGTLNHTLLTLHRIREAGLTAAGIVLVASDSAPDAVIESDNRKTLADRSGSPILGTLPYSPHPSDSPTIPTSLFDAANSILESLAV